MCLQQSLRFGAEELFKEETNLKYGVEEKVEEKENEGEQAMNCLISIMMKMMEVWVVG